MIREFLSSLLLVGLIGGAFLFLGRRERPVQPSSSVVVGVSEVESISMPPSEKHWPKTVVLKGVERFRMSGKHGFVDSDLPAGTVVDVTKVNLADDLIEVQRGAFKVSLSPNRTDFLDQAIRAAEVELAKDKRDREVAAAAQAAIEKMEENERQIREWRNTPSYSIKIMQVLSDGCLATRDGGQRIFLRGMGDVAEGQTYNIRANPSGRYSYTTVLGAPSTVEAWSVVSKY